MKKNALIGLAVLTCAVFIVLPVNTSVKHLSSNRSATLSVVALSGAPLPMPTPPGLASLTVSGAPLPMPTPPGFSALGASGAPLPMPTPPGFVSPGASGAPLPMPTPPGLSA